MKSCFFLLLSVFITSLAFAQDVLLTVNNYEKYDLNIISNEVNVFVDDSVYVLNNKGIIASKSNRFNNLDINQINDSVYKNPGGGSLYKMDSKHQFKRILHKPRMEQSFFGSASFVRNDTILQYGGYGNFSYKNDLIFVDSNLTLFKCHIEIASFYSFFFETQFFRTNLSIKVTFDDVNFLLIFP